jgi:hypothetical protein
MNVVGALKSSVISSEVTIYNPLALVIQFCVTSAFDGASSKNITCLLPTADLTENTHRCVLR